MIFITIQVIFDLHQQKDPKDFEGDHLYYEAEEDKSIESIGVEEDVFFDEFKTVVRYQKECFFDIV